MVELPPTTPFNASSLLVTTKADELTRNGNCSLREAVIAANTNTAVDACPAGSSHNDDTIILDSGTYSLTLQGKNEDAAATGDLDIKSKIKIIGASDGQTAIDASGLSDRVFHILGYGSAVISKVTIKNGSGVGGGIFNMGTLTLSYSSVLSNTASGNFGGGLKNDGTATLNNSTFSGNRADNGGGIYNRGSLILNNSTISGNTAKQYGGGIKNQGTLKLNNVTISANTAEGKGGGVLNFSYGKTYFKNTIIAGNIALNSTQVDCGYLSTGIESFNSQGYNLVGASCPSNGTGDQTTANPGLGPLQNNGGPTSTHALLSGSPAIDRGNPNGCKDSSGTLLTTDQRGEPRPVDGNNDTIVRCDIGAFEAQVTNPAQTGPIFTVNTTEDPGDGLCTVAHCSLREAINAANARLNDANTPDEVHFDILPGGLQTISPTTTLPAITDTLKIDGSTQPGFVGTPLIALDGSLAQTVFNGLDLNAGSSAVKNLVIQNFGSDGIRITGAISRTTVLSNTIFNNGGLGINLGSDGVTPNDPGDPDVGANNLQNFPILTGVFPKNGGGILIDGLLNSTAATPYILEFFTNPTCDPTNFGEGQAFLGTLQVTTDSSGDAIFTGVSFPTTVPLGQFVTATATGPDGTSEFSQCVPVSLDNDSWPTALPLTLAGNPRSASFEQSIDLSGQSRWYKFTVQPNSQLIATLTNLPANYDLTVYKDIAAAFDELTSPQDLTQLDAEFAPDAFAAEAFARGARTPDMFAPEAFAAEAFAPADFAAAAFARGARTPDAIARGARTPDAFAPDAYAPDAYAPDALARGARTEDAIARGARTPEAFSSAQTRSLIGISAFEGTSSEGVLVNTWNNSGDFYVRVRGRNGAFSPGDNFHLEITLVTKGCEAVSSNLDGTSLTAAAGNYRTIILADWTRMANDPNLVELQAQLAALAARSEVAGVVVDVGG